MTSLEERRVGGLVSPSTTRQWLLGQGWHESGRLGEVATLFARDDDQVLLPMDPTSSDFRLRWYELVSHLAATVSLEPDALLMRISREGADVAEFRAIGDDLSSASIPLLDLQTLLASVRQMVAASANAAVMPRSHFGRSISKEVRHHTHAVRVGTTRAGSYIVPVISPVPYQRPQNDDEADQDVAEGLFEESVGYVPFARQAMRQLATSLTTLRDFADDPESITGVALTEAVGRGVSYEMAAGIADALEPESITQVDVSFSWSEQIRTPELPTEVTFPRSAAAPLKEISEALRNQSIVGQQELTGYVKGITRNEDLSGRVVIRAVVGDQFRQVVMEATAEQCDMAGTVLGQRGYIHAVGKLEREPGKQLRLSEITDFRPARSLHIEQSEVEPPTPDTGLEF
jgi:hypothetical protein